MINYWNPESEQEHMEMYSEMINSTSITSIFNWLNAQAHCLGKKRIKFF